MRDGRCDIVVNCVGTTHFVPHQDLEALDDALIDEIFTRNVRGPFAVVRALRPLLERSDDALVVNVAYCVCKAALDNMMKSRGRALAPRIRVVCVSPGLSDTDFVKQMERSWRDEQAMRTPRRQLARPIELGRYRMGLAR